MSNQEFLTSANEIIQRKHDQPLFNLSVSEFCDIIKASTIQATEATKQVVPEVKKPIYSRSDLMEMFHISYPTFCTYEKKKYFKGVRIGHKYYYSAEDVEALLENIPKPPSMKIA